MHVNSLMPVQISIGRLMWSSGSIRHEIASCSLVSNELFEHMLFPLTVIKEICIYIYIYIIQIYSGITCGRVLNGELYTCKLYKLINLCWSTGCFVKLHFTPRDDFIEGFSTVNIRDLAGKKL